MDRMAALEAFVKVSETQSFTEAAERLGQSKSAISRHISALEAELGARLFHRSTRTLALTEAGQSYYERMVRILSDVEEANRAVTQLQAAPRGRLRINAPMSFGFLHLAGVLPDFLERFPEVTIDLVMNDRFVDLVDEGFDVAVRIGGMVDSTLIAKRLGPIRRVICASPAYLQRRGTPRTPDDLRQHDCLLNSNVQASHEWSFSKPEGGMWSVDVRGPVTANNGDALRVAALKGLGLTLLPTFIVGADLQAGNLVTVLDEYVMQRLSMHAVYPTARHLSPKVRAFVDFLAERFGSRQYWDLVE
jgi:DNA-binding transcriptional LysR family regulator